jgi:hypothetical protein
MAQGAAFNNQRGAGAMPAVELWTGPMAWVGADLRPVENWSREFPESAVFVRGELVLTLSETIGDGMTRQTERALPSLIRLEKGKAVEFHAPGLDGRCWTFRLEKCGRTSRWKRYADLSFPATEPAGTDAGVTIEYATVQTILPMNGTRRHIAFMIRDDGSAENLAGARDPDSGD